MDRHIAGFNKVSSNFVRTAKAFAVGDPSKLEDALANGDRILDGFAKRYGTSSPTLHRKEKYIDHKREYFFAIDDAVKVGKFFEERGFALQHKARFYLEYYQPRGAGAAWRSFERVLRLGHDHHDQSRAELIYTDQRHTTVQLGPVGAKRTLLATESEYLSSKGPMGFDGMDEGRRFLDRLDFELVHAGDWDLSIFGDGPRTRDTPRFEMSVSSGERSTMKFTGTEDGLAKILALVDDYPGTMQPLQQSMESYIMAGLSEG